MRRRIISLKVNTEEGNVGSLILSAEELKQLLPEDFAELIVDEEAENILYEPLLFLPLKGHDLVVFMKYKITPNREIDAKAYVRLKAALDMREIVLHNDVQVLEVEKSLRRARYRFQQIKRYYGDLNNPHLLKRILRRKNVQNLKTIRERG